MKKSLLENYNKTAELLRELKKEQEKMRAEIIAQMKSSAESAGDYVAVLTDCERAMLDKKAIIEDHGTEFIDQYTTVTSYQKLEVKKAA